MDAIRETKDTDSRNRSTADEKGKFSESIKRPQGTSDLLRTALNNENKN